MWGGSRGGLGSVVELSFHGKLAGHKEIFAAGFEGMLHELAHLGVAEMLIDVVDGVNILFPHKINPKFPIAAGLVHDFLARTDGVPDVIAVAVESRVVEMRRANLDFVRKDHENLAVDGLGVSPVVVDYLTGLVRPFAEAGIGVADDDVNFVGALSEANVRHGCGLEAMPLMWRDFHSKWSAVCDAIIRIDGSLDVFDGRADADSAASGYARVDSNSFK